jgi:hypothetical protein
MMKHANDQVQQLQGSNIGDKNKLLHRGINVPAGTAQIEITTASSPKNMMVSTNDYSLIPLPNDSHDPIKHKQTVAKGQSPP